MEGWGLRQASERSRRRQGGVTAEVLQQGGGRWHRRQCGGHRGCGSSGSGTGGASLSGYEGEDWGCRSRNGRQRSWGGACGQQPRWGRSSRWQSDGPCPGRRQQQGPHPQLERSEIPHLMWSGSPQGWSSSRICSRTVWRMSRSSASGIARSRFLPYSSRLPGRWGESYQISQLLCGSHWWSDVWSLQTGCWAVWSKRRVCQVLREHGTVASDLRRRRHTTLGWSGRTNYECRLCWSGWGSHGWLAGNGGMAEQWLVWFWILRIPLSVVQRQIWGVEGDAVASADIEPFRSLEEGLFDWVRPHEGIVNTLGLPRDICDDFIKAAAVAITRRNVSLGGNEVPIATPGGDEGGQVPVMLIEGYVVVAVPCVKHCLVGVGRDGPCLVERWLGVVSLADSMLVERLVVNSTSRLARLLGADDHPVTPGHRCANWDRFNHSKADILVEASFHIILPVDWNRYRGVEGDRTSFRIHHQAHWGKDIMGSNWCSHTLNELLA